MGKETNTTKICELAVVEAVEKRSLLEPFHLAIVLEVAVQQARGWQSAQICGATCLEDGIWMPMSRRSEPLLA